MPPQRYRPLPVTDLSHRIEADSLQLSWTLPVTAAAGKTIADNCVVYRARQPISDAECTGCPVPFVSIAEVAVDRKSADPVEPVQLTYTETLPTGFAHTYKVVCFTRGGEPGGDSNIVNFRY